KWFEKNTNQRGCAYNICCSGTLKAGDETSPIIISSYEAFYVAKSNDKPIPKPATGIAFVEGILNADKEPYKKLAENRELFLMQFLQQTYQSITTVNNLDNLYN